MNSSIFERCLENEFAGVAGTFASKKRDSNRSWQKLQREGRALSCYQTRMDIENNLHISRVSERLASIKKRRENVIPISLRILVRITLMITQKGLKE